MQLLEISNTSTTFLFMTCGSLDARDTESRENKTEKSTWCVDLMCNEYNCKAGRAHSKGQASGAAVWVTSL